MKAATSIEPVRTSAQHLGIYAANDSPEGSQAGVYRVPGQGWYTLAYREHYGPYTCENDALVCLAAVEARGPSEFLLWLEIGTRLARFLAYGLACVALAWALAWGIAAL